MGHKKKHFNFRIFFKKKLDHTKGVRVGQFFKKLYNYKVETTDSDFVLKTITIWQQENKINKIKLFNSEQH